MTVNWSNNSHPTGVVKPGTFPLTAKAVLSKVHETTGILFKILTDFHKDGYILNANQK